MPNMDLLEQDIEAIKQAGGNDNDVLNYLKQSGISYKEEQPQKLTQQPQKKPIPIMPLPFLEEVSKGVGLYMKEAQPAFKLAVTHPETFMGQVPSPQEIQRTTQLPWADIYRQAGGGVLPFAQSQTTAGQLVPQAIGELLNLGTRPSTYVTAGLAPRAAKLTATMPMTRRFLARQTPTLAKGLLKKYPVEPIMKQTPLGEVDITKPLKPSPEITFKKIKNFFSMNKDFTLEKATEASQLIDQTRTAMGQEVGNAISSFKDKAVNEKLLYTNMPTLPKNVASALGDPMYGIEFLPDSSVKPTIGNLHKIQQALGDFMTTKDWVDASRTSKEIISRVYGRIAEAIKITEPSLKQPIEAYHNYMTLYKLVNKTLRDTSGTILESRLRKTFGMGIMPERTYVKAWQGISSKIPLMENIMKSVISFNRRQFTKKIIGGGILGGGLLYGLRRKTGEVMLPDE